jgi:hypothetical protein
MLLKNYSPSQEVLNIIQIGLQERKTYLEIAKTLNKTKQRIGTKKFNYRSVFYIKQNFFKDIKLVDVVGDTIIRYVKNKLSFDDLILEFKNKKIRTKHGLILDKDIISQEMYQMNKRNLLTKEEISKFKRENGYNLGMSLPERNIMIVEEVKNGKKMAEVARKYNISKQRVKQLCSRYDYNPMKERKESRLKKVKEIKKDIKSLCYCEIKEKHNVTTQDLTTLRNLGLNYKKNDFITRRDKEAYKAYQKGAKAKELISDKDCYIHRVDGIYRASSKFGFKKYPHITRNIKGLYEDKKVIKLILKLRENKKMSFAKIAEYLNNNGYRTPQGVTYKEPNLALKYKKIKQHKLK